MLWKKVEELGQLECSKIKKEFYKNKPQKKQLPFFEETSNFIPIESLMLDYFNPKEKINAIGGYIISEFFLHNTFFEKNEEKKIVIF